MYQQRRQAFKLDDLRHLDQGPVRVIWKGIRPDRRESPQVIGRTTLKLSLRAKYS